ncbi:MAG: Ig-like domain-containing protein, partial [Lachnospiraceae bacterium]|nr:Ig-like domain-containing protein [Lachnospiraceae bacterium]
MIKNRKNIRILKRVLALVLAFVIVISFGLYHSSDRVLQAEALPDESAVTETVAEAPPAPVEEAPPVQEEVVEISLPEVAAEAPAQEAAPEITAQEGTEQAAVPLPAAGETAAEGTAAEGAAAEGAEGTQPADALSQDEAAAAAGTDAAALEQVTQSKVLIDIKGNQTTVVYTGKPQSVSGFSYQAHTENDNADVSGAVSVSLTGGQQAAATATEPGTYSMNLQPGMFQAQSDQYQQFEIRIARDGKLTIEEAPEEEKVEEKTEEKEELQTGTESEEAESEEAESEETGEKEKISEETGGTAEEAAAETDPEKTEEITEETGEETSELEAEEGEGEEELLELEPLEEEEETEEEEEKDKRPAQVLRVIASDGAVVTVSAPEGTLPDGAYVTASVVSSDHAREVIDAMLGEEQEVVSVVVYDITIRDRDGNEIQPDGSVQVSISGASVQGGESGGVYHVSGDGASMVSGLSGRDASFSADHFSEYAVVTTRSVSGDSIDSDGLTLAVGESVIITPPSKYKNHTLRWASSNSRVASVNEDGLVTALAQGETTIQLQYLQSGWFSSSWKGAANYDITVVPAAQEPGITLTPKTVSMTELGQTAQLRAELEGGINEENTIIWETSDPSVATVENGLVTSRGAGTAVITAKVAPDEDDLYGNVYEDTAEVTVALSSYNLFHYALIPGADKDQTSGSANDRWFGLGVTKINGAPNPSTLSQGVYSGSYQIGEAVKALYPDLSYGGKTYQYAASGSPQASMSGYYTVTPFRVVVANGANSGNNGYNNVSASGKTYHLDYICVLNEEEYCSANFAVQFPGSTSFDGLTDYARRVTVGTAESSLTQPAASAVPATQKVNGVTYRFDGWYRDSACTVLSDFAGTVEGNTTYYGRYVPSDAYYRVEYYYDGVRDDSMTDRIGPAAIGTVVTGFTEKAKTGFTRSSYEPRELTVTANESANIIRVYYTKRLLNYTVSYYLYGTQQEVSPSRSLTIKSGETAQAQRIAIEGYTPADSEEIKTQVITENGQQIIFYYRQNVVLTANSLTAAYTGEEQSVEGFTASVDGVVFEDVQARGAGTAAGSYPVRFERDLTGTVDESGRFIVSSCREGVLTIEAVPVTVTAVSSGKIFGEEDPVLEARAEGLKGEDTLVYTVERQPGEDAGSYPITVTGEEQQGSYLITYLPGTFTITTGAIPLTAVTAQRLYDGTPLAGGASANLPAGTQISYSTDGGATWREEAPAITDAGTLEYLVRAQNHNYETAQAQGRLTIGKRSILLTSADAEKEYDGTPLTTADKPDQGVSVSGDGFVTGEGADFTATGSQLIVGESANTFDYTFRSGTSADNYDVQKQEGVLRVLDRTGKYEIQLQARGAQFLYDGTEKRAEGFEETSFTLNGNTYTVSGIEASAVGTAAGSYPMEITGEARVADASGNDVTPQFDVTVQGASLTVLKRNLEISSASVSKQYDGRPLTTLGLENQGITIAGDGFAAGEGAAFEVTGSQTAAGSSLNSFRTVFGQGTDAANYNLTEKPGTLTVVNRDSKYSITVKAVSDTLVYNGQTQSLQGLAQTVYNIDGIDFTVSGLSASGQGLHAGTWPVSVTGTARVTDPEGNDVTEQFAVLTENGTLEIRPRTLVLTSADAAREYDGTPLTEHTVNVSGDGFAPGDGAEYTFSGTQTLQGESANTFTYTITGTAQDGDYDIEAKYGLLQVRSRGDKFRLTLEGLSGETVYDGTSHELSGFASSEFSVNGQTYRVEGITAQASGTHAGTYPTVVTGSPRVLDSAGNDVTAQFYVSVEPGHLVIGKRSVHLTSATVSKEYDGAPLTADSVSVTEGSFAEGEGATYTVTGTQTVAGSSANSFTYTLNGNTSAEDYNISVTEGLLTVTNREAKYEIVVRAVSGQAKYDGQEHRTEGLVSDTFVIGGQTYRVEGLTAAAGAVDAGKIAVPVTGTPVVRDAQNNDVTEQFVVRTESGTLEISKRLLILTSESAEKVYDGTALKKDQVTVSGDGFAEGEGAVFTVTGQQLLTGSSENAFTCQFNENTKKENYEVRTVNGLLTVTGRPENARYEITLEARSGEAVYDAAAHTVSGIEALSFEIGGVHYNVEGAAASVSGVDAGTYEIPVTGDLKVRDSAGNDVTDQFRIVTRSGSLTIAKRHVTLTSPTAEQIYNGLTLTAPEIEISGDGFAEGEGVSFTVTGSRLLTGISENTFTYRLNEGTKAENYEIRQVLGTLTVLGRSALERYEITVSGQSASALYDGADHSAEGIVTDTFTIEGRTYTVSGLSGSRTERNAGTYEVPVTGAAVVQDSAGNDVTDQFNVRTQPGTLTILPREVILTSADAEKEYDGTALTTAELENSGITVSGDGFAAGEGASYTVSGSQTLVGVSSNTFTYELNEGTEEANYRITVVPG